jgi:hypothetical protein
MNMFGVPKYTVNSHIDLESLNESFITLVPKSNNLEVVNDFKPISLLNSSIKL